VKYSRSRLTSDPIHISRGAAAAQAVTRFIDWAGGLPVKNDAYYLPILFRGYIDSRGAESREAICQRLEVPALDQFQLIDVVFLGVWDTVMALGPRFRARGWDPHLHRQS
jgi:hypothetical protein